MRTFPIKTVKEIRIDDLTIILLDHMGTKAHKEYWNRNVLCIDKNENIVWQIEELENYPGGLNNCPFTEMHYSEKELRLINWCSLIVAVDYKTGKILSQEFTK